ncbi:MAG: GFA family protein [Gammaproteobacteria bacterium]|nr:GFA family protein [Gammaproteobacteria bacterium]
MPNTQSISGSCLCGQVSYKAVTVPLFQAHCHCQDCRKNGGSAFAALVFVPIEDLTWKGDTHTFCHLADSGAEMTKHFCPNCGSQLFGTNNKKPSRIHIKVGTIDNATWFQPQCNVWASSRLPSTPVSPDVKDFATMPQPPQAATQPHGSDKSHGSS